MNGSVYGGAILGLHTLWVQTEPFIKNGKGEVGENSHKLQVFGSVHTFSAGQGKQTENG